MMAGSHEAWLNAVAVLVQYRLVSPGSSTLFRSIAASPSESPLKLAARHATRILPAY